MNTLSKRLLIGLAASLLATVCFAADDPGDPNGGGAPREKKEKKEKTTKQLTSSSVKASEVPIPRIWIGLIGSYTPLKLIHANVNGLTDTAGDTINATSAQGQAGGGLTVNARIFRNYWLSAGAIYRYTGYDSMYNLLDTNLDSFVERSRARLIDFPVLVKYTGRKWNLSKYTFYELGATYRDVLSRKTTTNWTDALGDKLGPAPTGFSSGVKYKQTTFGATAGAGIIAKDDFGIIVSPEVRYTRWMGETFNSQVLSTARNQLEITVSFGF